MENTDELLKDAKQALDEAKEEVRDLTVKMDERFEDVINVFYKLNALRDNGELDFIELEILEDYCTSANNALLELSDAARAVREHRDHVDGIAHVIQHWSEY